MKLSSKNVLQNNYFLICRGIGGGVFSIWVVVNKMGVSTSRSQTEPKHLTTELRKRSGNETTRTVSNREGVKDTRYGRACGRSIGRPTVQNEDRLRR